ncbi:MAG: hypothetical protein ACK6DO_11670, partial [Planctomycetia bacterium]
VFVWGGLLRVACEAHGSELELLVDIAPETARHLGINVERGAHVAITPRRARVFIPGPEYVI